ncbi:MAG TPA: hypothetical protein VNG13_02040 [Mycobacteriales bacterium]|nr:hypothetical protein [Mycobacteriales bacterium]
MPSRSWRWRGYRMSVELRRADAVAGGALEPPGLPGGVTFADPLPDLHVRARDPAAAVAFVNLSPAGRPAAPGSGALARRVASRSWYHTIDLPGDVTTPGQFDHRSVVARYGLPEDMAGLTALDVATFDGFWAFEMERRGARTTALDLPSVAGLDFPPEARPALPAEVHQTSLGTGFRIAHDALGSSVRRVEGSVYDLDPGRVGRFDFVHVADLLLHLERPLEALRRIRSVTAGRALISDAVTLDLPPGPAGPTTQYLGGWHDVVWWLPSLEVLAQMVIDAGFRTVRLHTAYKLAKTDQVEGLWRAVLLAEV